MLSCQIPFGQKHLILLLMLSPVVTLDGDVPDRVWTGKNVSYDHLRVFGCKTFVHL